MRKNRLYATLGMAVLLALAVFAGGGTLAFALSAATVETTPITVIGASSWQYENDISYYCEITAEEDAFVENGNAIQYHIAEKDSTYEYIQDYVSVQLDEGDWHTVREINADADKYTYIDTGTPYWHIKAPVVIYGQTTKTLRLYFHKDLVADAQTVRVRLNKGLYVDAGDVRYELGEDAVCEHTSDGWEMQYDTRVQPFGLSATENWVDNHAGEFSVCDVYFSREAFVSASGKQLDFAVMDAGYRYLQDRIAFNGETMRELNKSDMTGYTFTGFPYTIGIKEGETGANTDHNATVTVTEDGYMMGDKKFAPDTFTDEGGVKRPKYLAPVFIYADSSSHFQIRIHKKLIEAKAWGDKMQISFAAGVYNKVVQYKTDGSGERETVSYAMENDITVTKGADNKWSSDTPWQKFEETPEVIIRKDIDFDAIDFSPVAIRSVGRIVEYGAAKMNEGRIVYDEYVVLYFDKPVCNQSIPYATRKKSFLLGYAQSSGTLTSEQVDALFDYRIDIYLNEYLKIDGKTIAEIKANELTNGDAAIRADFSGGNNADSITIYVTGDSGAWLDPNAAHTFEIAAGFRTPLMGEVQESEKYYYDAISRSWSKTDYESDYEWEYIGDAPAKSRKKKCGGNVGTVSAGIAAVLLLAAAGIVTVVRAGKGKKESRA